MNKMLCDKWVMINWVNVRYFKHTIQSFQNHENRLQTFVKEAIIASS